MSAVHQRGATMKLSIIIPIYNKSRYLSTILQQVREQSFADYECLLIDDGSTDGSGEICDEFSAMDSRFRVFHIPNGGVSHARNIGLDAAQGDYITFIDADDGIKPDYLENLVRCVVTNDVDLAIGGYEKVTAEGEVLQRVIPSRTGAMPFSELICDFTRTQTEAGIYGCCVAKVFPRCLVEKIRFNEQLKLAEDFDFYLSLYEIVDAVYLDDYSGYLYLQDADNSTGNTPDEKIDYLAQLRIHLHCRSMLQKRAAYEGENREILENRLADYAYFVLFHTPSSLYKERFVSLRTLCQKESISLVASSLLRKWLFFCLRYNQYYLAKLSMSLYRLARKIRNGVKKN